MSNIEQLRQEGIAARVTWDFGAEALPMAPTGWARRVLADMAEVDAEEAATTAAEWDAYADQLTEAHYRAEADRFEREQAPLLAALDRLEADGVKAAFDPVAKHMPWVML